MPTGICAECGLEGLGPGLMEDEAFLCCDCDIELRAYSTEERSDPSSAAQDRQNTALQVLAETPGAGLPLSVFDPLGYGELQIFTDPQQKLFAGVGTEIWGASAPLARYLQHLLVEEEAEGMEVLELGAGCGVLGLWLWLASEGHSRVCITDVPRLCPLMELNVDHVRRNSQISGADLLVRPLRWGLAEDLKAFVGESWDLVIGSDICYNEDKVEPLLCTLQALQPQHGAIFCLSLCRVRGPGAWALKERCEEENWYWQELARDVAADGAEVLLVQIKPPPSEAHVAPSASE